jgi:hypothetical protein
MGMCSYYKSVSKLLYQERKNGKGEMAKEIICNNLSSFNMRDNEKD